MELKQKVKNYLSKDNNISKVCIKAKMSRPTFFRRKKNPGKFTAFEIKAIKELVGVEDIFKK